MSLVRIYSKYFTMEKIVKSTEVYDYINIIRQDYTVDSFDIVKLED